MSRLVVFILRHRAAPWFVPALLAGALVAVYGSAFRYPSFNPEHALYYVLNARMGWAGLADAYFGPGEGFYRPTAFYGYFQLVQAVVGPHGVFGFKAVSLALLAGWGCALYRLGLILWAGDRLAAGLAAGLAMIHPIHYVPIYETTGFDLIYQILVLVCLILHLGPGLAGRWRWPLAALEVGLFALALTAKEQAVALAPLLVAFAALDRAPGPERAPRLVATAAIALLGAVYLKIYLARVGHVDTGAYRTSFDPQQVAINLRVGLMWLSHLFTARNPVWPLEAIQDTRTNLLFGLMVAALVVGTLAALVWRREWGEGRRVFVCALMLGAFLALPVYAGGRPWHFGLALAAFALIEGRALARLVRRLEKPERRVMALAGGAALVLALSAGDFSRELTRRLPLFRLNTEALRHPPVAAAALPRGAMVLYVTGGDDWSHGAGNLFRLVYRDPTLDERPVASLAAVGDDAREAWLAAPAAFFFSYREPVWRDCSAALRRLWRDGAASEDPECARALTAPGN